MSKARGFQENLSLLKNSFVVFSAPCSTVKSAVFVVVGLVLGLFWIADQPENDYFNMLDRLWYFCLFFGFIFLFQISELT